MAQGYYGTESNPLAELHSERKVITPQTSGGSLEEGRHRLRTDLNSGDRIATYEINVGNGVEEAPVFPVSMNADSRIEKVRQVFIPGEGWGFVPLLGVGAVYPQLKLYNDGTWYDWHTSAITTSSAEANHDAQQLSLSNGDAVSMWADETGNGHTQSAVNSPTYQTGQINGNPGVLGDGTADGFIDGNYLGQQITIYIVYKTSASGTGMTPLGTYYNFSTVHHGYKTQFRETDDFTVVWGDGSSNAQGIYNLTTAHADGNPHILCSAINADTGDVVVRVDDEEVTGTQTSGITIDHGDVTLMYEENGPARFFDGHFGEVLVYTSMHDGDTRDGIVSELQDKWDF